MENNIQNIDDFLFQKLQNFEDNPDLGTFEKLHDNLEHLEGIDLMTLNLHLNQLEENPDPQFSKTIFDAVEHFNHPIDFSLNQNLQHLEDKPENMISIFPEEKKSRKKMFLFFFFGAIISSSIIYLTLNQNNNSQSNSIDTYKKFEKEKEPEKSKIIELKKENIQSNTEFNYSFQKTMPKKLIQSYDNSNSPNLNLLPYDFNLNDYDIIFDSIKNHKVFKLKITYDKLPLEPLKKFNISAYQDLVNTVGQNNINIGLLNNQHKVFYEFGLGLNNINYNKQQLNTEYIHKDALNIIKQTLGNFEAGQSLRANIGYHLTNKIHLISGFNFDFQSYSNQVNYIYTDIPIYDLNNGKILSYLTRPASSSPSVNQKIRTKVNEVKVPLSISFYTFRIRQTSIWANIGAIYNLKNTINSQYFNFKDGSLNPYTNNIKISNNTSTFAQIRAITPLNQSLKLVVQFGITKSQNKMSLYNQNYSYNQLTPSINLGLHFNLKFNPLK